MKEIEKQYSNECRRPSDIYQHLPTLRKYVDVCKKITKEGVSVVEMGVRDVVSTWAFLVAVPKKLTSYDINNPASDRQKLLKNALKESPTEFKFIKANVLDVEIEETDLLFIDTLHRGSQLKKELELHSNKVKQFIILHDTVTFYNKGEDDNHRPTLKNDGLGGALEEFLQKNNNWTIKEEFKNNNGLTVLARTI